MYRLTAESSPDGNGQQLPATDRLSTIHLLQSVSAVNSFHIAATFNASDGVMSLYVNNSLVATDTHSAKGTSNMAFSMAKSDCYLGAGQICESKSAVTRKQFMGEFHEFALSLNAKTDFPFTHTLLPNFRNTLLYLRFEEVDL